jgi:hypothetical protein
VKKEKENYFPFFAAEDCARDLKSWLVLVFSVLGFIFDAASGAMFFVAIFISPFVSGLIQGSTSLTSR